NGVVVGAGASANTIGGTAAGARNTITGNNGDGVLLQSSNNVVQGNFIGTNAAGNAIVHNSLDGVGLSGAADNTIGGTASGAGNAVLGNSIHGNGGPTGLGIDLADDGTTANGPGGSGRTGPNHLQNHPVFVGPAALVNGNANATVTFSSLAGSTFRLEFFVNA